jgi:LacI family transcriptional regulator
LVQFLRPARSGDGPAHVKERITQTDIARAAGVHNTTVSLALRNSPLIPAPTRDRIRALAKSMGYCPDPALQALAAYRKARRNLRSGETLAYVTQWETQWGWRRHPIHEAHYHAAEQKAAELGYTLEHLWLGPGSMSRRRFSSVLLHRGIRGVIFAAARTSGDDLSEVDWSRLAAVGIGWSTHTPAVNQITADPVGVVRLAMRHVLYAGYHRIGLVLPHRWDKLTDQVWSAAFHAEQYRCHLKDAVPVLRLHSPLDDPAESPSPHEAANDAASLLRWYRQYRPQVVLGTSPAVLDHIRRSGFRVPEDFAYADLHLPGPGAGVAGVWTNAEKIGELAVEMLAGQLQQNALGLPGVATVTTVGGSWCEGETLPERSADAGPETALFPQANLVA